MRDPEGVLNAAHPLGCSLERHSIHAGTRRRRTGRRVMEGCGLVTLVLAGCLGLVIAYCAQPKPKQPEGFTQGGFVRGKGHLQIAQIHCGRVLEHWTSTVGPRIKDPEVFLHRGELVIPTIYGTTKVIYGTTKAMLGTKNLETKTLRCKHCGVQIKPGALKCANCGAPQ